MTDRTSLRPRRSALFVPAVNERALAKAAGLDADVFILDLEDSVAPERKAAAREAAAAALREARLPPHAERAVRINGFGDGLGLADLEALREARPDAVVVPKVTGVEEAALAGARVQQTLGAGVALWLMMETPGAVLDALAIARTARSGPLGGFLAGLNDLAKDTRAMPAPGRGIFLPALANILYAARAEGLVALDGVYNEISDEAGFLAECRQGRELGYDGKTLIHPSQVAPANEVYAPAQAELAWARRIIAAFDAPEAAGKAVMALDGQMVERLHLQAARRLVALAERLAER
ncbi:MAG: CoA ester lyase [Alphaproteobacteria bacterium]|nr:CoA ester lyase [Alphaproteobacteria bacterium]